LPFIKLYVNKHAKTLLIETRSGVRAHQLKFTYTVHTGCLVTTAKFVISK